MIEFTDFDDFYDYKYKDFTGVCKFLWDKSIRHYKNGRLHNESGPAIEYINSRKEWWLNGKTHREDGPAVEWINGDKSWWFKGKCYGNNKDFSNESWIEKVECLKH